MDLAWAHAELTSIFGETLDQLDPAQLIHETLVWDGDRLSVAGERLTLSPHGRLYVLGVGKSALPMAFGAEQVLGDRLAGGLVVTKRGIDPARWPLERIQIRTAGHPVPDQASVEAGVELLALAETLNERDLVIMLVSGGGSALVEAPLPGLDLSDIADSTDALLRAGADIRALNAVRRRLSRIKAGGLARAAAPARIVNLVISDVLGSPLDVIASGLSVATFDPDSPRTGDGIRPEFLQVLPPRARAALESLSTQHPGGQRSNVVRSLVLADSAIAARVAAKRASGRDWDVNVLGTRFDGEASAFARTWAELALAVARGDHRMRRPACLIGAGELTVTVRGGGRGGRNTELALAAALAIDGAPNIAIASLATDGDDGTTGAAGGIVTGASVQDARSSGLDAASLLIDNDSARFLEATGGLVRTGLTGVNVNDLYFALVD